MQTRLIHMRIQLANKSSNLINYPVTRGVENLHDLFKLLMKHTVLCMSTYMSKELKANDGKREMQRLFVAIKKMHLV